MTALRSIPFFSKFLFLPLLLNCCSQKRAYRSKENLLLSYIKINSQTSSQIFIQAFRKVVRISTYAVVNDFVNTMVGFDITEHRRSRADEYAHHMSLFREECARNVSQDTPNRARRLYHRGMKILRQMKIPG